MKIMFLTTFSVRADKEHYFTKGVINALIRFYYNKTDQFILSSVIRDSAEEAYVETITFDSVPYVILHIPNSSQDGIEQSLTKLFHDIAPDIIHSQMIEGYDVAAAKTCGIPIVLTIHIGGIICPRGGGNGLRNYNDQICNTHVGEECKKCLLQDLPAPFIAKLASKILPTSIKAFIRSQKKQVLYLSPLANIDKRIDVVESRIELLKYAHIIAANYRLAEVLRRNGLSEKVHIIPHGVVRRKRIPLPMLSAGNPVKFFMLGRIQYSKAVHEVFRAFDGIPKSKYELHIIGDAETSRKEQRYYNKVRRLARNKNIIFHGRLDNTQIDSVIAKCHIMIQATICMEVYGIAIAESLSIGRPVLATKCGGAEMQIKDGYNGWLIKPHDIAELRQSIIKIINSPEVIKKYASNAELPMPIDNYVTNLNNLYHQIAYD